MSQMLAAMHNTLMKETVDHPCLKATCNAMARAVEKVKEVPEPVKAEITIKGDEILVPNIKGVSFWALKFSLDEVKGEDTGRVHDAPGKPYNGNPVFKAAYDKKRKLSVIPLAKKAELLECLKKFDLEVAVTRA